MTRLKALMLSSGVSLILAASAGWACYQWGVSVGASNERKVYARAVEAWQRRTHKALVELEAEREERRDALQETIEVIRYVDDPTGCADERVPDAIADRLRDDPGPR